MPEILFDFVKRLNEVQDFLDKKGRSDIQYKRTYIAFLAGLIKPIVYSRVKRQVLYLGIDELIIEALDRFIKQDDVANRLWKAYCYMYFNNKSVEEASTRFEAPLVELQEMVNSNAIGLFFPYVKFPKEV